MDSEHGRTYLMTKTMSITTIRFTLRLFTALLLGAIVGLERQWRQRMAGTRTNALVAAGASAFVMAGSLLVDDPSATGRVEPGIAAVSWSVVPIMTESDRQRK
jgi:uncharacterized membrane protein YhiD involved in acid resistance